LREKEQDDITKAEYKLQLDPDIARAILAGVKTYEEIGKEFGVWHGYVINGARRNGIKRKAGRGSQAWKNRLLKAKE
jgi:hypothetical protein